MWGSVVEAPRRSKPICFGSAFFIEDSLRKQLWRGEYPCLLVELCRNPILQTQILDFKDVERASTTQSLNFCGGLFAFPSGRDTIKFFAILDKLQDSLLYSMAGFQINYHAKQIFEQRLLLHEITCRGMRQGFGADIIADYSRCEDPIARRHRGTLFGISRQEVEESAGGSRGVRDVRQLPVGRLLSKPAQEYDLPQGIRWVLLLEEEGVPTNEMHLHLFQGDKKKGDSSWQAGIDKLRKHPDFRGKLDKGLPDSNYRDIVRQMVRDNPQELGILPQLTPKEKRDWKEHCARVLRDEESKRRFGQSHNAIL